MRDIRAVALNDLSGTTIDALRRAGAYVTGLTTPTVRLGVTGLARAGKTVFVTALVRNLITGARLPFFLPAAEGRIIRAYLEPQPDDDIPRFAYEDHLAALAADPPQWPESTRRISQLRITIEYEPLNVLMRQFGTSRLHVDIVDYPGEWLIDLPLLALSYRDWSDRTLTEAREPRRAAIAAPLLTHIAGLSRDAGEVDEQAALAGAAHFTRYLAAARTETLPPTLGPGRFLLPGDLEGSPLLTFFPTDPAAVPASLAGLLERRFEAYKARVVKPFFRDHFARLDRQIVLVDALAAIDQGAEALADLSKTLADVLACFKTGAHHWYSPFLPRRIDRILLSATKADHLHHTNHDRLEAILGELTAQATERARFQGADVKALAMAALRATKEGHMRRGGEDLACIIGTPLPGERIGTQVFDGQRSAAIFPGDIPATLEAASIAGAGSRSDAIRFVRFRPTRIPPDSPTGAPSPWPHIRLDRAIDYLLGDILT